MDAKRLIEDGKTVLGIELGPARINEGSLAFLAGREPEEKLEDYLETGIFRKLSGETIIPHREDVEGFETFMEHYKAGLAIEKSAIEAMDW